MKIINYILLIFGLVVIAACKKKPKGPDTINPEITLQAPVAGSTVYINHGEELHIEFTATDNQYLQFIDVNVIDQLGNSWYNKSIDVDKQAAYPFHVHISPTVNQSTSMRVIIKVTDEAQNSITREIDCYVAP